MPSRENGEELALSAVGLPYNTTPEQARHEFVAGPCRTNIESTVGAVGTITKPMSFLVLQAASSEKLMWQRRRACAAQLI